MVKGIFYCEDCLRKTIRKQTPDKKAYRKALKSGMFQKAKGTCTMCGGAAKYKVGLGTAQNAIRRTQTEFEETDQ